MDRGTWWATVHGVTESRTSLSDWHFHFHTYLFDSVNDSVRTRKWGNSIGWSWNGQSASSLPSRCLCPRVAVPLTQLTWFQVPLLQVVLPRILPAHPVRLQAALPGTAVHEHHPQTETVQIQWVRMADGYFKRTVDMSNAVESGRDEDHLYSGVFKHPLNCSLSQKKQTT